MNQQIQKGLEVSSAGIAFRVSRRTFASSIAIALGPFARLAYGQSTPSSNPYAPRARSDSPAAHASIRPFRFRIPQPVLTDLRRRLAATRWPDQETVPDRSQGVQLKTIKELVRYWQTAYDWRKAEAKLNALPQFITRIDDVDIHFIHVRSRHANALPLIMTHGWPGSVFELLKTVGPLTDPTALRGPGTF
ncbi:MAG TPA: epoxide hydrolase N-terminal domain-containing protein [Bryobacteraceae bacterium]|nr:epoxide hydrolase N-terminal domain-containing protein [Bryobacteraceae bacterium]